jgi:hypothetical protein
MQVLDGQFTKPPIDSFWTKAYTRLYCTKTRRVKSPEPSLVLVQVSGRKKPAVRNSSIALIRIPKLRKRCCNWHGVITERTQAVGRGMSAGPSTQFNSISFFFTQQYRPTQTDMIDRTAWKQPDSDGPSNRPAHSPSPLTTGHGFYGGPTTGRTIRLSGERQEPGCARNTFGRVFYPLLCNMKCITFLKTGKLWCR